MRQVEGDVVHVEVCCGIDGAAVPEADAASSVGAGWNETRDGGHEGVLLEVLQRRPVRHDGTQAGRDEVDEVVAETGPW